MGGNLGLSEGSALVPYSNPALFSIAIGFLGIWLFSKVDASARAKTDKAGYDAQYVRSETGIGSVSAVSH